ncbi:MAG: hypothetical protein MZV64_44600 [Ignavibacteriales bacterium]|nr:hypothetical protein [Ignavibacteriales bacterium]
MEITRSFFINTEKFILILLHKENELKELQAKESSIKEKRDFYSFQIKEIDNISPQEDEEDKID